MATTAKQKIFNEKGEEVEITLTFKNPDGKGNRFFYIDPDTGNEEE